MRKSLKNLTVIISIGLLVILTAGCEVISFGGQSGNNDAYYNDDQGGNSQRISEGLYNKAPHLILPSDNPINISTTMGDTIIDKAIYYINYFHNSSTNNYTLLLDNNIDLSGTYINGNRNLTRSNVNLTIMGIDEERIISLSSSGFIFVVNSYDTSLTLRDNITLVGRNGNNSAVVAVTGGASFTMSSNSSITGNSSTSYNFSGGGVYIEGAGTTFTMQDNASVHGNTAEYGGGVFIGNNASFLMRDMASISGNNINSSFGYGGGVYVAGTFNMEGGTISGNRANEGGGVYIAGGTFTMSGGTVYGSNASYTLANTAFFSGSSLYRDWGTAVYNYPGNNILPHTDSYHNYTNYTIPAN